MANTQMLELRAQPTSPSAPHCCRRSQHSPSKMICLKIDAFLAPPSIYIGTWFKMATWTLILNEDSAEKGRKLAGTCNNKSAIQEYYNQLVSFVFNRKRSIGHLEICSSTCQINGFRSHAVLTLLILQRHVGSENVALDKVMQFYTLALTSTLRPYSQKWQKWWLAGVFQCLGFYVYLYITFAYICLSFHSITLRTRASLCVNK